MKVASLQVEAGTQNVSLDDAARSASVSFTVTNRSGGKLLALMRPLPGGAARDEWFTLSGEATRSMEPGESMVVTVQILVPPGAAAGEASLRLRATNENDANNDWADSAACSFTIPAEPAAPPPVPAPPPPPPAKPQNLPLWAAIAILALALVAGAIYLWQNRGDDGPPDNGPTEAPTDPEGPKQPPKVIGRFNEPKIGPIRLDWCLTWSTNCGKPAADAFCESKNMGKAKSFAMDADIGSTSNPTRTIGDARICDQPFCDGFKFIQCRSRFQILIPKGELIRKDD